MRFLALLFGLACAYRGPRGVLSTRSSPLKPSEVKFKAPKPRRSAVTKVLKKVKKTLLNAVNQRMGSETAVVVASLKSAKLPPYRLTQRIIQQRPANSTSANLGPCPYFRDRPIYYSDDLEVLAACTERDTSLTRALRKTWAENGQLVDAIAAELNLHPSRSLCTLLQEMTVGSDPISPSSGHALLQSVVTARVIDDLAYCRSMFKEIVDVRVTYKLGPPLDFKTAT